MKYCFLLFTFSLISSLFAQEVETSPVSRNEIFTDLSGAISENFRVDFSRRGKKKGAVVLGIRTRTASASVIIDTNQMVRFDDRSQSIPKGLKALDISIGVKSFIGNRQPQRGFWFQLTALTSLAQWRSNAYKEAQANSFFPDEFREQLRTFGLEGDIGYRYVLDNGLSINAFISWTTLVLREELISERFTPGQRKRGGFDSVLSGSFLTIGYVW